MQVSCRLGDNVITTDYESLILHSQKNIKRFMRCFRATRLPIRIGWLISGATIVVISSTIVVRKHLVCFCYEHEMILCSFLFVLVWMILERHFVVGLFDLLRACCAQDTQDLVVIMPLLLLCS